MRLHPLLIWLACPLQSPPSLNTNNTANKLCYYSFLSLPRRPLWALLLLCAIVQPPPLPFPRPVASSRPAASFPFPEAFTLLTTASTRLSIPSPRRTASPVSAKQITRPALIDVSFPMPSPIPRHQPTPSPLRIPLLAETSRQV
ncbi:hypothetical protein COCMIDRAFT_91618 [Bipolaris oryzae ATCC 44560]|uniref:Uncharacterized protein n=1 Tax=Bipolaris oryzae ATCC 44560 TaxID=930090 RepID=W6Z5A1_COCMI|nr:uncharacterized protein COCMIDRAFT_91618 [Bipolaris oryzae ATCC 44560]EUC46942.1 hypothetical protein COCMIDRAFT_91618 [Bipolaris oryzae ATCC 44560]